MPPTDTPPRAHRIDRLKSGAVGWIASADGKAVALLTVAGALLALIAAAVAGLMAASPSTFHVGMPAALAFATFCAASVASIGFSAVALVPRTNRMEILVNAGWKDPSPWSRTFFADVAKLSSQEFNAMLDEQDASLDARDAAEQAFVLQHIATAKMVAIQRGVVSLALSLIGLALCLGAFLVQVTGC